MGGAGTVHRARRILTSARDQWNLRSADRRALPDFLIIGAQKAGTTSLYRYLAAHPDIVASTRKEVHFFDLNYWRGERWYRSLFPLRRRLHPRRPFRNRPAITGEASPYYLFHPLAPERAAQLLPDAKLIVLLRDPVERAWSHYRHEVANGRETLTFPAALAAEPARLAGADPAHGAPAQRAGIDAHRTFSYVARGHYAEQLAGWLAVFPCEAFLIIDSARLFSAPAETYAEVLRFLGVNPHFAPAFEVHNAGRTGAISDDLRRRLADEFRSSDEDLERLLGRRFSWMQPGR